MTPPSWAGSHARWAAELIPDAPVGRVLDLATGARQTGLLAIALANRPLLCVDEDPDTCRTTERDARRAGLAADVEVRCCSADQDPDGERFALVLVDPVVPSVGAPGQVLRDAAREALAVAAAHVTSGGHVLIQLAALGDAAGLDGCGDLHLVEVRSAEQGAVARFDRALPSPPTPLPRPHAVRPPSSSGTRHGDSPAGV